jgi:hypothetical protein
MSIIREANKKQGVCYAVTDDGIEVPVIDVTHPAFRVDMSAEDLDAATGKALADLQMRAKTAPAEQQRQLQTAFEGSFLAPRIAAARGKVLDGMGTYYLKLGPDNLGKGYSGEIDRAIAGSLPCLSIRLRLRDVARLMADCLATLLAPPHGTRPEQPLHLLNIAGGAGMDSLNAVLLLRKEHAELLHPRRIVIHLLDSDAAGPAFCARATSALQAANGPLQGLTIEVRHEPYDWASPGRLSMLAVSLSSQGAVVAGSSEGGLFEYGSDEHILSNLRAFGEAADGASVMVGTVTRADGAARIFNDAGGAAIHPRGLQAFDALIHAAGWRVTRSTDSPLSHNVVLKKEQRGEEPGVQR